MVTDGKIRTNGTLIILAACGAGGTTHLDPSRNLPAKCRENALKVFSEQRRESSRSFKLVDDVLRDFKYYSYPISFLIPFTCGIY